MASVSENIQQVGAGLQITPNASRLLQQWEVPDSLWKSVAEPTSLTVHRFSGKVLAREAHFNEKILAKYGAPFVDIHRVDLQQALFARASELGVKFFLNERVETIDFTAPHIITASGNKFEGDLIVAADGLWSRCRSCFSGVEDDPVPTGDLAYRIVLSLDEIEDETLREWVKNPEVHFWIGPGSHAVGYSLRGGQMYNIVLLVPDTLPSGVSKLTGSVEEMKSLFTNWDPM